MVSNQLPEKQFHQFEVGLSLHMKFLITAALMCFNLYFCETCKSQSISGNLNKLSSQPIQLEGFNGFQTYPIATAQTDEQGNFELKFSSADYGVAFLKTGDEKPFFVILGNENTVLNGELLSYRETLVFIKGNENRLFELYSFEHPRREQALSAWIFLQKIYEGDSLFAKHKATKSEIEKEKQRIKAEDATFLNSLPPNSYVKYYLPLRKLISSVSAVAQYRTDEIPATIQAFRKIDYADNRLYKSGLLKDALESHFWLLENSGKSIDSVFIEMKTSVDAVIASAIRDEKKLNEISDYLFDLLERQSLFQASEYLAIKLLNDVSCTINNDLAKQLETYRAMKKGNTAPDIHFRSNVKATGFEGKNAPEKLSDLKSKYTVVVFGASWCPKCKEELPEIARQYSKWKANGVEVVLVSLDEDKDEYIAFVKDFPFISTCDFKKWQGEIVKDYYVFGTPTMFLLNEKRKILLRPNSVKQMDAWVDWYLIQGNPIPE